MPPSTLTTVPVAALTYLTSLVARQIELDGTVLTVTAVRANVAVVSAQGVPALGDERVEVPVAWVQNGIDWLTVGREVPRPVEADGWAARIAFLLLLLLPGAEEVPGGGVVLPDRRAWNLRPGNSITSRDLQMRFGGQSNTRVSVSHTSRNVFILAGAGTDKTTRWQGNVLHVPGNKIRKSDLSDASATVLHHLESGLALRVFWRSRGGLVYAGEFTLDPYPSHYVAESRDREGQLHKRIVFRLRPVGAFVRGSDAIVQGTERSSTLYATTPFAAAAPRPEAVAPAARRREALAPAAPRAVAIAPAAAPTTVRSDPPDTPGPNGDRRGHGRDTLVAGGRGTAARLATAGAALRAAVARAVPVLTARGPWPPVLLCSVLAVALTTWGWTSSPLRAAVTIWFLLVCPGMALVRLLPWRGTLLQIVLAVAAGLAVETVLAEAAVIAHLWSPGALLLLLFVITIGAVAVDLGEARTDVAVAIRMRVFPRAANESGGR